MSKIVDKINTGIRKFDKAISKAAETSEVCIMVRRGMNRIDNAFEKHMTLQNLIYMTITLSVITIILGIFMESTPYPG